MGAAHSQSIASIRRTSMDPSVPDPSFEQQQEEDPVAPMSPTIPRLPPPRMQRVETFDEKLYRKFKQEPLIPIGCFVTAYFLGSGIRSFYQRDAMRSQRMMRARVGAQFATLMIFIGYYGMNQFNLKLAPGMAPHKKDKKDE